MKSKNLVITIVISLVISQLGCRMIDQPIQPQSYQPAPATTVESMEKRFSDTAKAETNAVESALLWSGKYEELSVKAEKLREENNALTVEGTDLKHQLKTLQTQLDQTKAELKDANEFLQEMNLQLNKWKGDVLGFRDEMRKAQATQLGALKQIMQILGAELTEP